MSQEISPALKEFIRQSPHVQQVYFTADGNYHLSVYKYQPEGSNTEKLYSWIDPNALLSKKPQAILERYAIVSTMTREQILGEPALPQAAAPAAATTVTNTTESK